MDFLLCYLLIINALTFAVMLLDKVRAIKKAWRVPEATLLTLAVLGGSLGGLMGMYLFRHKTRKPKFTVTLPLLLILQGTIVWIITRG